MPSEQRVQTRHAFSLSPALLRSTFSAMSCSAVQFYLHQPLISGTAAHRLPTGEDRALVLPVPCGGVGVCRLPPGMIFFPSSIFYLSSLGQRQTAFQNNKTLPEQTYSHRQTTATFKIRRSEHVVTQVFVAT